MRQVIFVLVCAAAASILRAQAPVPTFSRDVSRIFQQQCQTCHRPGDIGPMSLMDFANAAPYASRIKQEVLRGHMPPWKPVAGFGDFRGARRLTAEQIDTIVRWADAGAPEGNPAELPAPLAFPDGWTLGTPDKILRMEPFSAAQGRDVYRCFSLPTELAADQFISGVEIRAGNRSIVHHVLLFADRYGISESLDLRESGQGYTCYGGPGFDPDQEFVGGWAPGARPAMLMPGVGMRLYRQSRIAMQVHYHTSNGSGEDQTQIGLYFSRTPVDKIARALPLVNMNFVIPAGAARHQVNASITTPALSLANVHLLGIAPHMHQLGREINVQAVLSNQTVVPLIRINDWSFEWQSLYEYVQPVRIPGGTRLEFQAFYDNSANNLRNPNSPPREVRWGEQTTDEMALVFFIYTMDTEHLSAPQISSGGLVNAASYRGSASAPGAIVSLFGSGFGSAWEAASSLPLPRRLGGGTRVLVDGVEAPLFYVSPTQINFQVPFEAANPTVQVEVVRGDDGRRQLASLTLGPAQPGIFTATSDGAGPAAALHGDGGAISAARPAARGEVISLYATGLGRVTPEGTSGAAPGAVSRTVGETVVTVGGLRAEVSFSGLAPGFAGLYQVNFTIPSAAASGNSVPVRITSAGIESNTATLALR